ncbi:hypothetical protein VTI74DRAFT_1297 [Chaetomium olivicolor]
MAPSPLRSFLAARHGQMEGSSEPLSGLVISVVLSMLSISALSAFMTQRYLAVKTWKQLPAVQWLVFAIYVDSFLFVLATGILQFAFGVSYSGPVCESAILLCLVCYVTTKLIYMFLVEKAYIIRSSNKKPRLKSKLYLFNSFGMIGAYCIVVVPNFILRFARVENGECIIGMQRPAMIPLIVFDLLVNVYLTIIFLMPLSQLYSYKNSGLSPGNRRLRTVAVRTFIGSICTLTSSIVNLSVLVGLNGEPGWVCLMCCNSDILFSAMVIQWVTSRDSTTSISIHDDTLPGSDPRSQHKGDAELSPIPPRTPRHRLSSIGTDTPNANKSRRSQITLSTEDMVTATTHHDHDDASTTRRPSTSNSDQRITRQTTASSSSSGSSSGSHTITFAQPTSPDGLTITTTAAGSTNPPTSPAIIPFNFCTSTITTTTTTNADPNSIPQEEHERLVSVPSIPSFRLPSRGGSQPSQPPRGPAPAPGSPPGSTPASRRANRSTPEVHVTKTTTILNREDQGERLGNTVEIGATGGRGRGRGLDSRSGWR